MDIGRHCSTCGRLDFLPFDCRRCGQVLCGDHRTSHECAAVTTPATSASSPSAPASSLARPAGGASSAFARNGASSQTQTQLRPQGQAHARPRTGQAAAATHHDQSAARRASPASSGGQRLGSSAASSGPVKSERAAAALTRLKQLVGGTGRSAPGGSAKKPAQDKTPSVSSEMKRVAVGDSGVKFADRLYYNLTRPPQPFVDPLTRTEGMRPARTLAMYFNRSQSIGQVLDRAAKQLGVTNGRLELNGRILDLAQPITTLPQGSTLTLAA